MAPGNAYAEAYTYDKNGNIRTLTRKDQSGVLMDNFKYAYNYTAGKINQLVGVEDLVSTGISGVDVDDQDTTTGNYTYNAIGQLITDVQENITDIDWTADGKVRKITQSDGIEIEFVHDAGGNRTMKVEQGVNMAGAVYTYYVYDAAGNLMATYDRTMSGIKDGSGVGYTKVIDKLYLSEKVIYGTGRLGVKNENHQLSRHAFTVEEINDDFYDIIYSDSGYVDYPQNFEKTKRRVGEKYYELSNHLNNVLEVVTDRKLGNTGLTAYEADIISYSDYYPFGMVMPGRNGNANNYRYGFQGQEKDDEIKGEGNSLNYKYRMYDPRIGRFFATDPLEAKYAYNSPYAFCENRVTDAVELEGLEVGRKLSGGLGGANTNSNTSGGSASSASGGLVDTGADKKDFSDRVGTISSGNPENDSWTTQWAKSEGWFDQTTYQIANSFYLVSAPFNPFATSHSDVMGIRYMNLGGVGGAPVDRTDAFVTVAQTVVPIKIGSLLPLLKYAPASFKGAYVGARMSFNVAGTRLIGSTSLNFGGNAIFNSFGIRQGLNSFETSGLRISQTLETNAEMKTLNSLTKSIQTNGFRYDMSFANQMQVFQNGGINYLVNGHHRFAIAQRLGINNVGAVLIDETYLMSKYGITPAQLVNMSNKAVSTGNKIRWY